MQTVTFITGNQKKAEYLEKYLWFPIQHIKLDLDEIQSLDLKEIVEHKVRQAYEKIRKPVLVEDASLECTSLGRLPWTFIKFFIEELWLQWICELFWDKPRWAISSTMYAYYDGTRFEFFVASHPWTIAQSPRGETGYGWDKIYEPAGYNGKTRAELDEDEHMQNYLQIKPLEKVREFLMQL